MRKRKIFKIEIPDWALERHIFVFAGSEPIAIKPANKDVFAVKIQRCNLCGMCCTDVDESWIFGVKKMKLHEEDVTICGKAVKSKAEDGRDIVECGAGALTPYGCTIKCGILRQKPHPMCSLEYSKPWAKCGDK